MNSWKIPLLCGLGIVVFVGFGEGITWIITPVVVVGVLAVGVLLLIAGSSRRGTSVPAFHGDGNTRGETMQHERRHVRVLNGLGVGATRPKAWKDANGNWEGVVYPRDEARWNALTPTEQAAVFIAGSKSMGRRKDYGCESDLAAADSLASRGAARRIARRYV